MCVSASVKDAQGQLKYELEYESRRASSKHDDFRSIRRVLRRRPLRTSERGIGGVVCPCHLKAWCASRKEFVDCSKLDELTGASTVVGFHLRPNTADVQMRPTLELLMYSFAPGVRTSNAESLTIT